MSYTGDGKTPSSMALYDAQTVALQAGRHAVAATASGDASYSIGFDIPPALLAPSVSVSYSSAAGAHSVVGRGWSLNAGMTISKPLGPAAGAYRGIEEAHTVSGAVSGTLFKAGGAWTFSSQGATPLFADLVGNQWTIKTGGVTYTLTPVSPNATSYRVIREQDRAGNLIEYTWSDAYLQTISYGHTSTTGGANPWTTQLQFVYEPIANGGTTSGISGNLQRIEDHLVGMEIWYNNGASMMPLGGYELAYSDGSGDEQISSVWRVSELSANADCRECESSSCGGADPVCGACGAVERSLIADFGYTHNRNTFATADPAPARSVDVLDSFSLGWSTTQSEGQQSHSSPQGRLVDLTGDGLPDYLTDSSIGWYYSTHLLDFQGPWAYSYFDISNVMGDNSIFTMQNLEPVTGVNPTGGLEDTRSLICDEYASASFGVKRLLDIDGDGFQDLVWTDAVVPDPWMPSTLTGQQFVPFCADPAAATPTTENLGGGWNWHVAYGTRFGFEDEVALTGPLPFLRLGANPHLPQLDRDCVDDWGQPIINPDDNGAPMGCYINNRYTFRDATMDFIDANGDGWLDVVESRDTLIGVGRDLWVYLALPSTGGWDLTAVNMTANNTSMRGALTGLSVSEGVVDQMSLELNTNVLGTVDTSDTAGQVVGLTVPVYGVKLKSMEGKKRFIDLNGDGITDYVEAKSGGWTVHLGTGDGFSARNWASPRSYLSKSVEGTPWRKVTAFPSTIDLDILVAAAQDNMGGSGELWGGNDRRGGAYDSNITSQIGLGISGAGGNGNSRDSPGEASFQLLDLIDMDGDGRVDLVDAEVNYWYRNTGSGFESNNPRALPAWMRNSLGASHSFQSSYYLYSVTSAAPTEDIYRDYVLSGSSVNEELRRVMDVDRDGLPDLVQSRRMDVLGENEWLSVEEYQWDVTYGKYPKAGLLDTVVLGAGATTTLTYESSSYAYPSGRGRNEIDQEMASRSDLLVQVETVDPITNHRGRKTINYEEGKCADNKCMGFRFVEEENYRYDPVLIADPLNLDGVQMSRQFTEYTMARDYSVPILQELSTTAGNPWSGLQDAPLQTRVTNSFTYQWNNVVSTSGLQGDWSVYTPWASSRTTTTTADDATKTRTVTINIDRDAAGNVIAVHHNAANDVFGREQVSTYTDWTTSSDGSLAVPTQMWTESYDWMTGVSQVVEQARFSYDDQPYGTPLAGGAGLMTNQQVAAGVPGDDLTVEWLVWDFVRDARGRISSIFGPAGSESHTLAWAYGGNLPASASNALGHTSTTTYTKRGSVETQTDPNGVVARSVYDGLGRPTGSYRTGAGGAEYLVAETAIDQCAVPYLTTETQWRYDGAGATSFSGYAILDGYGAPAQTWKPDETGMGFIVQETHTDISGATVRVGYPHRETAMVVDLAVTSSPDFTSWSEYDGMGFARTTWGDKSLGRGESQMSVPEPGQVYKLEPSVNAQSLSVFDTHGRLAEVQEGTLGSGLQVTGNYYYDGRNRVAIMQDAAKNEHWYAYDGAGRLQQVWRRAYTSNGVPLTPDGCPTSTDTGLLPTECQAGGPIANPGTVWTPYFAYDYDGPNPIAMWEGAEGSDLATTWEWDAVGRNTRQEVFNRTTLAYDAYEWQWDLVPAGSAATIWGPGWIGAVRQTTDPSGEVHYAYEPGTYGGLGQVSEVVRTWNGASADTRFGYGYDFAGQQTKVEWPGDLVVTSDYGPEGWLLGQTVNSVPATGAQTELAQVQYLYDDFGMMAGFAGLNTPTGITHLMSDVRASPSSLSNRKWSINGTLEEDVAYGYRADGLLSSKTLLGWEPFVYSYDHRRRVTEFKDTTTNGTILESFDYDVLGNPKEVARVTDGLWYYDPATFSEVPGRFSTQLNREEEFNYDSKGRMTEWHTRELSTGSPLQQRGLVYDGAGRLVSFSLMDWTAATSTVNDYHYDASNKMVLEERTTPGASLLQIFRFQGHRQEGGAVVTETLQEVLPMLRMENGSDPKWVFHDVDQHALHVWNDVGFEESFEVSGVYGGRFDSPIAPQYYQGADWKIDGLHGGEVDRDLGIVHRGQRHSMIGDGRWFQAEPLLALGAKGDLAKPGRFSGVYAAGNPVGLQDTSGFFAETPYDVGMVVLDVGSIGFDLATGNYGAALLDTAVLGLDAVAVAVPGVPAVAGTIRHGSQAIDLAKALWKAAPSLPTKLPPPTKLPSPPTPPIPKSKPKPPAAPKKPAPPDAKPAPAEAAGHRKKRPSTKEKHEKGDGRRNQDAGNEKGDKTRQPPRKPPPGHKGPWPPKPKP